MAFDGAVRDPESALNRFGVGSSAYEPANHTSYPTSQKPTRVQEGPSGKSGSIGVAKSMKLGMGCHTRTTKDIGAHPKGVWH